MAKKASDLMLYNEIQNITSQYAQDKDAGLYTETLALDPERPFKSRSGKICKTAEDIADAIMAESAYYMEDLKRPNANLYLYLAATEGSQGKEAADVFCKYFKEYSPNRALSLVYLKLQSDGGITIGSKHYQSPDELKHENDGAQIALVKKAVTEKDSMLLVWLSDIYGDNLKSTDTFSNLIIPEQFFLLGLLPFLSFKEFGGNSWNALRYLIDSCPGRSDLFETYAAQGLPLTGQGCGDNRTPIDYTVCNFNELNRRHGTDTVYNLIRLLHKLGADVNEYSSDSTCPLINAYDRNNADLVKLLLELGADENQYHKIIEQRAERKAKVANYQRCVAAGIHRTVGLKTDGTVVAIGKNEDGQCNVGGWRGIVAVAGGYAHTTGLKTDGTVVAIGKNEDGQCNVGGWRDIVAVASRSSWTVGLKADGTVVAVGDNRFGQCNVSGWRGIVAVAAGGNHTVGLKADGTVVAIGKNEDGQCNVSGWGGIVAVAAGHTHTVGLRADGTVVAAGKYSYMNQNNNNKEYFEISVSEWHDIVAVATVHIHTVGLKVDGTVIADGYNKEGRCNVSSWRDIVAVTAGGAHTVGLKADGTVVAVGSNKEGQCNVSGWRDIGPVPEEKIWEWKGLCRHCGGKLGGLFTKKCKDCGKEQ